MPIVDVIIERERYERKILRTKGKYLMKVFLWPKFWNANLKIWIFCEVKNSNMQLKWVFLEWNKIFEHRVLCFYF